MKSKFEYFIEDRQGDLDVEKPDLEGSWILISSKLQHQRKANRWQFSIAASILILISIGLGVTINKSRNIQYQFTSQLAGFSSEASEQEQELQSLIADKITQINNSSVSRSNSRILKNELNELDELSDIYYNDLQERGGEPKVINSILRCSQLKLRIIENTLLEISKSEKP